MIPRNVDAPGIRRMLDEFISDLVGAGKITGRPLHFTAGWIPVRASDRIAHGNLLLAGDAAGHAHPITGAGVFNAVIGGRMAGEWAARAIAANDPGSPCQLRSRMERAFRGHTRSGIPAQAVARKRMGPGSTKSSGPAG